MKGPVLLSFVLTRHRSKRRRYLCSLHGWISNRGRLAGTVESLRRVILLMLPLVWSSSHIPTASVSILRTRPFCQRAFGGGGVCWHGPYILRCVQHRLQRILMRIARAMLLTPVHQGFRMKKKECASVCSLLVFALSRENFYFKL